MRTKVPGCRPAAARLQRGRNRSSCTPYPTPSSLFSLVRSFLVCVYEREREKETTHARAQCDRPTTHSPSQSVSCHLDRFFPSLSRYSSGVFGSSPGLDAMHSANVATALGSAEKMSRDVRAITTSSRRSLQRWGCVGGLSDPARASSSQTNCNPLSVFHDFHFSPSVPRTTCQNHPARIKVWNSGRAFGEACGIIPFPLSVCLPACLPASPSVLGNKTPPPPPPPPPP